MIEKIEECQQILRDIEINKKRDDYNVTIEDAIEVYKNQNSGFTAKDLK